MRPQGLPKMGYWLFLPPLAKQISRAGFERRLRHSPTGKVEAQMYLDSIQQT